MFSPMGQEKGYMVKHDMRKGKLYGNERQECCDNLDFYSFDVKFQHNKRMRKTLSYTR